MNKKIIVVLSFMFLVGCLLIGVGIDIALATPIAADIGFAIFVFFGLLVYLT